jgi:hypothetical protein
VRGFSRERALAALPPLLLAAVALWQIHLARAEHLSPWKGGGFGMFSSADVEANRHVRIYLRRGAAAVEVAIPSALEPDAAAARVLPSEARLRRLGRAVASHAQAEHGPVDAIRVEAWRRRFAPDGLEPRPVLLRQLELDASPR